jgi:hypothetical protein
MSDNVIPIEPHLPVVDKELMDTLRSMLSEAQSGRLRSYAAVYITGDGNEISTSHYFQCYADQIAIEAVASGATDTTE